MRIMDVHIIRDQPIFLTVYYARLQCSNFALGLTVLLE